MSTDKSLIELPKENFRLIGALDSARTAYPLKESATTDSWWLPRDDQTWLEHGASAESMAVKQVIWGDVIALPRNQFLDSPPWFNIAEYLMQIRIPTFTISLYGSDFRPEPISFLKDIADTFDNPNFSFSAWPGLNLTQRQVISNNLKREGIRNIFNKMFDNVTVDSAYKSIFDYQKHVLQKLYEYITLNKVISIAIGSKTTLWQKIWADAYDERFLGRLRQIRDDIFVQDYQTALVELSRKPDQLFKDESEDNKILLSNKWLNQRTNLYREIFKYDNLLRSLLHQHIDTRYCETLSESCTGAGRYGCLDRTDTLLTHEDRDILSDNLDASNDPDGLLEDIDVAVIQAEHTKHFLSKVVEVLNDFEIGERIKQIRQIRQEKNISQDFRQRTESEHLELMSSRIPELVIKNSGKAKVVLFTYNNFLTITISFGLMFTPDIPLTTKVIVDIFSKLVVDVLKNKLQSAIENVLHEKGEKILFDRLFEKEKRFLTGKVRDWLGN